MNVNRFLVIAWANTSLKNFRVKEKKFCQKNENRHNHNLIKINAELIQSFEQSAPPLYEL